MPRGRSRVRGNERFVRVTGEMLGLVDHYRSDLARANKSKVSRSRAVRELLERGLDTECTPYEERNLSRTG